MFDMVHTQCHLFSLLVGHVDGTEEALHLLFHGLHLMLYCHQLIFQEPDARLCGRLWDWWWQWLSGGWQLRKLLRRLWRLCYRRQWLLR